MSRILAKYPAVFSSGALLLGAMAFGAATHYSYRTLVSTAYAAAPDACSTTDPCDAEDPDDCGPDCHCLDSAAQCRPNGEL
jgi:hypothetical protein